MRPLPRTFYARDAVSVAYDMVGCLLIYKIKQGVIGGRIVECEAYCGPEDLAAHSAQGRRTSRTEVMFGPPGYVYMFLLYGMHWAFNAVVNQKGSPHAVLVRAIEPLFQVEQMASLRNMSSNQIQLTNGPGKLCQAMGLTRDHYGLDLCKGSLFISQKISNVNIGYSERINVDYAKEWAKKPWRFYEKGNRYVSVKPRD